MYGTESIQEIPIDVNQIVNTSIGLKEGLGITGDVTVGDVRGKKTLTLDGNNMSTPITNIEELSLMPNLTELTLKNLNLTDLNGLQYLANLKSLWLDNTKVNDYSGLKYGINVTGFYPINNSITEENIISVTDEFINMPKLEVVRIRNNSELTNIPALNTLGNINTLYIEENANLTNIFGLSTVKDKTKLVNLYLNENNLTDIINNPSYEITNKNKFVIYHTHTCESYTSSEKYSYEMTGNYRTTDLNFTVSRVADEFAKCLEGYGKTVVHDKTYHDYPAYNGSYGRSLKTMQKVLETNKDAEIAIDLHRDAVRKQ